MKIYTWLSDLINDPQRFYSNPIDEQNTSKFVQRVLQASPRMNDESQTTMVPIRTPQGLERLPPELLDATCSYLPAWSIISMHRCSKTLAMKIPLDNAFWRDSLRDGSLHPHLWDLDIKWIEKGLQLSRPLSPDPTSSFDWKSAARLLATKKFPIIERDPRLIDIPLEYWNRCRIWNLIEEALDADRSIQLNDDNRV